MPDVTKLSAKATTIGSIVGTVALIVASYVGVTAKLDAAATSLAQLRVDNAAAHAELKKQQEVMDARTREQERLIVELSTTLRVKGIIR